MLQPGRLIAVPAKIPPTASNDAPAGVGLDLVAATVLQNYEIGNAAIETLIELQAWIRDQAAAFNGGAKP